MFNETKMGETADTKYMLSGIIITADTSVASLICFNSLMELIGFPDSNTSLLMSCKNASHAGVSDKEEKTFCSFFVFNCEINLNVYPLIFPYKENFNEYCKNENDNNKQEK